MLNRRELIASTVALSVAAQAVARPTPNTSDDPTRYFIASRDLAAAHRAARVAEASGATVIWIGADVTPVYTRLDLELRPAPFAVAGLTTSHHLFVLERLGWDRGLRTVRRAELGTAVEWRLEPRKAMTEKAFDTFPRKRGSDPIF